MTKGINTRELILGILLEVNRDGEYSHIAIRNTLSKYQFLPKQERAFITRVCEGTIEYMLQLDYIIDCFSKVKVNKMKAPIREILRSSVYQLKYMDSVPASAVCDEAVKLAQKKGFYSLKPFVNGVLRTITREMDHVEYPPEEQHVRYLSVKYSMPERLVVRWLDTYSFEMVEKMLEAFLKERPTSIRCRQYLTSQEETLESLRRQGVEVTPSPYLPYAFGISGYNHILTLDAFLSGRIQVQDVSSMLVAEAAAPQKGDYVIDLCAAPGGKALHIADKMEGFGTVDARDVSEYKVSLIEDNARRAGTINLQATCQDATVWDEDSIGVADVVLADVPCSGLGVIGKKPDIKYKMNPQKQEELVILQRQILDRASSYVRPGGTLLYSTCTIAQEENQDNVQWFLENYPYEAESLDPYLCPALHTESTSQGWLQLLPGIHDCDGFFLARLKRKFL